MKKLLCLVLCVWSLISCSGDDNNPVRNQEYVSFKIDGVQKNFKHYSISESQEFEWDNQNYILVSAAAYSGAIEYVRFTLPVNDVAHQQSFKYVLNNVEHSNGFTEEGVTLQVTSHNGNRITGTFSGLVATQAHMPGDLQEVKTITEGSFSIYY